MKVAEDLSCPNEVVQQRALWVPDIRAWRAKHEEGQFLQIVESASRKETRIYDLTIGIGLQFDESPSGVVEKAYDITWKFGLRTYLDISRPFSTSTVGHPQTFAIENVTGRYPEVNEESADLDNLVAVGESCGNSDDDVTSEDATTKGARVVEWGRAGFPDLVEDEWKIIREVDIARAQAVTLGPGPDEDWMHQLSLRGSKEDDDWGPGFL